jgi:hypothetical protein
VDHGSLLTPGLFKGVGILHGVDRLGTSFGFACFMVAPMLLRAWAAME